MMQPHKRTRADRIIAFIKKYPGHILSYNKIEQLAGVGQGTLSHYANGRPRSGIDGARLKKLEKALRVYGYDPHDYED